MKELSDQILSELYDAGASVETLANFLGVKEKEVIVKITRYKRLFCPVCAEKRRVWLKGKPEEPTKN